MPVTGTEGATAPETLRYQGPQETLTDSGEQWTIHSPKGADHFARRTTGRNDLWQGLQGRLQQRTDMVKSLRYVDRGGTGPVICRAGGLLFSCPLDSRYTCNGLPGLTREDER